MLEDFQVYGAEFLAERRAALLADEMRVGKTCQAIRAADMKGHTSINIFCPTVALYNWSIEYNNISSIGLPVNIISTNKDTVAPAGINICPYSLITNERIRQELLDVQASCAIIDEMHYLKNPEAKRTKAVYGSKREGMRGLVQSCANVWALSGTPIPNDPSEIWPLLRVFGIYKKGLSEFISEFCEVKDDFYGPKIVGAKNTAMLLDLLRPITLRRLRRHVLGETPASMSYHYMKPNIKYLPDDVREEYLAIEAEVMGTLDQYTADGILYYLDNYEFGSTLRRLTGLLKVPGTIDLAREILQTEKQVVIFAVHRQVAQAISEGLSKYNPVLLLGGLGAKRKQQVIEDFRAQKYRVLVANVQAGGESADFSTSARIISTELSTVPKDNTQALARCSGHRQKRLVHIDVVTIPESSDFIVNTILMRKLKMINTIFD